MYLLKYFHSVLIIICLFFPGIGAGNENIIKPGDVIEISVMGNENLSQFVTVSPAGTIDFLFFEGLPVTDLTLQGFQKILVAQLTGYTDRRPLITVRFADSYPIRITVLGQVARPGIHKVLNTSTIQGAIAEAGGFVPGAQINQIKLIRKAGEVSENHVVNMERFFQEGNLAYLPTLMNDDTIIVPGIPLATTVKVLGSVLRPGSYEVQFRASLLDVIYMAGGPTDEANLSQVKVVSPTLKDSREAVVNIKDLVNAKAYQDIPNVQPGDIVHIPARRLTWNKFIGFVRDISAIGILYIIVRYGRR